MRTIKAVIVGDGAVGKTCLLISYAKKEFPSDYVPTVFDNHAVTIKVAGENVVLTLVDTAGQEDYDKLRPLSYTNASVFIICFAVDSYNSFFNVKDKWIPEVKSYAPNIPYLIVGTQSDKRSNSKKRLVKKTEAKKQATKLGSAAKYIECSAKTREGVEEVFIQSIISALGKNSNQKSKCSIQ